MFNEINEKSLSVVSCLGWMFLIATLTANSIFLSVAFGLASFACLIIRKAYVEKHL